MLSIFSLNLSEINQGVWSLLSVAMKSLVSKIEIARTHKVNCCSGLQPTHTSLYVKSGEPKNTW